MWISRLDFRPTDESVFMPTDQFWRDFSFVDIYKSRLKKYV